MGMKKEKKSKQKQKDWYGRKTWARALWAVMEWHGASSFRQRFAYMEMTFFCCVCLGIGSLLISIFMVVSEWMSPKFMLIICIYTHFIQMLRSIVLWCTRHDALMKWIFFFRFLWIQQDFQFPLLSAGELIRGNNTLVDRNLCIRHLERGLDLDSRWRSSSQGASNRMCLVCHCVSTAKFNVFKRASNL